MSEVMETTVMETCSDMLDNIESVIRKLDCLPADHEPTNEDLWVALRQIESIAKGEQE